MIADTKILLRWRAQYLIIAIVLSSYLFILHQELQRPGDQSSQGLAVMRERAERLRRRCRQLRNDQRLEWSALYQDNLNTCTNVFFSLNSKRFQLCNILKGGSRSWKIFFKLHQIPHRFLADCQPGADCRSKGQRRLVQVRHPFERLLSAWRHIFQAEGFTTLWSISPVSHQQLEQGSLIMGVFSRFLHLIS